MASLPVSTKASPVCDYERLADAPGEGAAESLCASAPCRKDSRCTSAFAFTIVAVNCGTAIYHSRRDPWSVAFVLAASVMLLSLLCLLRVFESLPPGSSSGRRIKAGVWAVSTALTVMFSHRVAALMPFPVAAVIWGLAGSTIVAGFCMLFVCRGEVETVAEEIPPKVSESDIA
ncbi:uncharacterized protein LOC102710920 [Oryza brachyantha]|uniref:Uncharacterized protein n=1 Tax=Oryza brachyantha TaxID=4533 RepID=J3L3G0_ORYBR|nr:uncharacterized protein LOC102710920 [Oryza brachyantha]